MSPADDDAAVDEVATDVNPVDDVDVEDDAISQRVYRREGRRWGGDVVDSCVFTFAGFGQ